MRSSAQDRLSRLALKRGYEVKWRSEVSDLRRGVFRFAEMVDGLGRLVVSTWAYGSDEDAASEACARSVLAARA